MRAARAVAVVALGAAIALGTGGCCCPVTEPLSNAVTDALRQKTTVTEPEEDGPPLEDPTVEPATPSDTDTVMSADAAVEGYLPPAGIEPQDLVLIIYASETSEQAADSKRATYQGRYGDAAPILAVDRSDHYRGLEPGYWIVVSGYRDRETADKDLDWAKQHGIPGYIKPATKLCRDTIEIFELGD